MNDDQLMRLLRNVDEPAEPDPEFADRLFAQISRESSRSRGLPAGLLLVAAVALMATLFVGLAVGSGLLKLPWLSVEVVPPSQTMGPSLSESSAPSPTSTAAQTPTPAPSPSASPSASAAEVPPLVTPPPGRFPPGSTVTVIVDAVRVRSLPSISAPVIGTLARGDAVTVVHDIEWPLPVGQDGFLWYEVTTATDRGGTGWVAEADPQVGYYFALAPDACGELQASNVTLARLIQSGAWHRLACLGSTPVTVTGVIDFHCQGGTRGGTYEPAWMVDWCPSQTLTPEETVVRSFAPEPSAATRGAVPATLDLVSAPGGPSVQPRGTVVQVTGHFDDPAASGCVIENTVYLDNGWDVWDGAALLLCREQFVVTSIEPIGFIQLPPE